MKKFIPLFFLLLFSANLGFSQKTIQAQLDASKDMFPSTQISLFTPAEKPENLRLNSVDEQKYLQIDQTAIKLLNTTVEELITLTIPLEERTVELELYKYDFTSIDFSVKEIENGIVVNKPIVNIGLHYRGMIKGDPNSVVTMSIQEDEILIHLSGSDYDYIVHPQNKNTGSYIYYPTQSLELPKPENPCKELFTPVNRNSAPPVAGMPPGSCTPGVPMSFVVDFDMYQQFGNSTAQAIQYVTNLFNQVAILYAADNIDILLEEVFVNTSEDGYPHTTSNADLNHFQNNYPDFNGNLAHLLSTNNSNLGGLAYLDVICSSKDFRIAYSNIHGNFNNYPSYSWDVYVVAHEMGHNLGSRHTQNCSWNGGTIDDCGNVWAANNGNTPEGDACWDENNPIIPQGGGTVMSYCHLIGGIGINLNKGLGPQPSALIRSKIASANCLSTGDEVLNTLDATSPFTTVTANKACENGVWTDYYFDNNSADAADDILVLSINHEGQNIGEIGEDGFTVRIHSTNSANTGGGSLISSALHQTNPNDFFAMKRYWEVQTTRQPIRNLLVRFPYTQTDIDNLLTSVPGSSISDVLSFTLSSNEDLNPENDHSGITYDEIQEFNYNTTGSDKEWAVSTRSDFYFAITTQKTLYGGGMGILSNKGNITPFFLESFTGAVNADQTAIDINWTTAEEFNSKSIFLEKSFNGSAFETLKVLSAEGFSQRPTEYNYSDPQAFVGTNTYRLRMLGNKGTEIISDELVINLNNFDGDIVLYPNPLVTDTPIRVDIRSLFPLTGTVNARVYNSVGQQMFALDTIDQFFDLEVSNLPVGTYFLIINSDNNSKTLKFVKAR